VEKISYVKAAKELPFLSQEEVEREALRLGLISSTSRGVIEKTPDEVMEDPSNESGNEGYKGNQS